MFLYSFCLKSANSSSIKTVQTYFTKIMLTVLCLLYVVQVQNKHTSFETSGSEKVHVLHLLTVKIFITSQFVTRRILYKNIYLHFSLCNVRFGTQKRVKCVHRIHTLPSRVFCYFSVTASLIVCCLCKSSSWRVTISFSCNYIHYLTYLNPVQNILPSRLRLFTTSGFCIIFLSLYFYKLQLQYNF